MADFDISLSPPAAVLAAEFAAFDLDIRSFREPLKRSVQQVMAPSINENFEVGGRPPWEPLSDETIAIKGEDVLLVRTGKLKRKATQLNAWHITGEEATFTNPVDVSYGIYQQDGTKNIPARPFVAVQDEDEDKIEDVFLLWIQERLLARGFTGSLGSLDDLVRADE